MAETFDLVILGGGPVGEHAAGRAASAGLSTALVESQLVGGECSYWACMPSKTLLRPIQALRDVLNVPGAKQAVTGELDINEVLARRNWMVSDWSDAGQLEWLKSKGVSLFRGSGRLNGERRVLVESDETTVELIANKAVILATGSYSLTPPIEGLSSIRTWDNRDATSAKQVPRRLLVLGGGPVGVELAQVWRGLGSEEVTLIEGSSRLLSREEPFASELVAKGCEELGIQVILDHQVIAARREANDGPVTVRLDDERDLVADELLVAVGRRPRTADIGLESVGFDPKTRLSVEDDMSVQLPNQDQNWLYAIGDVNGRALLTHMGKYHARVAVDTILGKPMFDIASSKATSRVVFSDPLVASVGLTEAQARDAGFSVVVSEQDLDQVAAAAIVGERVPGHAKLVIDSEREVILGATFVGTDGAELLHGASIAVIGEVPVTQLRHAVAAFPTISEVWLELIESYLRNNS